MKTITAALSHMAISAAQVTSAIFTSDMVIQCVTQAILLGLQGYIASKNSNSDPKGRNMYEAADGGFRSSK